MITTLILLNTPQTATIDWAVVIALFVAFTSFLSSVYTIVQGAKRNKLDLNTGKRDDFTAVTEGMKTLIDEQGKRLEEMKKLIDQQEKRVQELEEENEVIAKRHNESMQEIGTLKALIQDYKKQIEERDKKILALEGNKDKDARSILNLNTQVETLQKQILVLQENQNGK